MKKQWDAGGIMSSGRRHRFTYLSIWIAASLLVMFNYQACEDGAHMLLMKPATEENTETAGSTTTDIPDQTEEKNFTGQFFIDGQLATSMLPGQATDRGNHIPFWTVDVVQ